MATPPAPSRRRRAFVPVLLGALAVLAAACGGGDDPRPTTTAKPTTTTAPPTAPLTGEPQQDAAKRNRPALIVKVDNTDKGFSVQEGIEKADLVFVEQTEQGTTRLAVVYQSQDAVVGPVRSARTSDIGIGNLLNRPLLAYSGANSGVLRQVRESALIDVGIDRTEVTPVYQGNQRGGTRNLFRYFLPTADLYAARGGEGGTPAPVFAYGEPGGEPVRGVRVGYGGRAATTVLYEWDAQLKGWARTQNDRVHQMAGGGARIAPPNVVVLITPYRNSGFRDVTGAASPEAVLEGSGEAWFLADGKLVRGTWNRPGPASPISFVGPNGAVPQLTPGQTWIELAPGPGSATVL